jgi:lipopolysaccharide export system protein LptC
MSLTSTRLPATVPRGNIRVATVSAAERKRAFIRARRHSVLVRVLKVALPVMALVAVGVLFISPTMLAHIARPDLKAALDAVEVTGDQLRMVNPHFEGFTGDKGRYVVSAKAAVQNASNLDQMQLEAVHGHLIQADNSWTDIVAKAGVYETKKQSMQLINGIVITTSANARAELDNANIDIDKKIVTSAVPVVMTMPNGTLRGKGLLVESQAKRFVLPEAVEAHLVPPKSAAAPKAAPNQANSLLATPAMSDGPCSMAQRRRPSRVPSRLGSPA